MRASSNLSKQYSNSPDFITHTGMGKESQLNEASNLWADETATHSPQVTDSASDDWYKSPSTSHTSTPHSHFQGTQLKDMGFSHFSSSFNQNIPGPQSMLLSGNYCRTPNQRSLPEIQVLHNAGKIHAKSDYEIPLAQDGHSKNIYNQQFSLESPEIQGWANSATIPVIAMPLGTQSPDSAQLYSPKINLPTSNKVGIKINQAEIGRPLLQESGHTKTLQEGFSPMLGPDTQLQDAQEQLQIPSWNAFLSKEIKNVIMQSDEPLVSHHKTQGDGTNCMPCGQSERAPSKAEISHRKRFWSLEDFSQKEFDVLPNKGSGEHFIASCSMKEKPVSKSQEQPLKNQDNFEVETYDTNTTHQSHTLSTVQHTGFGKRRSSDPQEQQSENFKTFSEDLDRGNSFAIGGPANIPPWTDALEADLLPNKDNVMETRSLMKELQALLEVENPALGPLTAKIKEYFSAWKHDVVNMYSEPHSSKFSRDGSRIIHTLNVAETVLTPSFLAILSMFPLSGMVDIKRDYLDEGWEFLRSIFDRWNISDLKKALRIKTDKFHGIFDQTEPSKIFSSLSALHCKAKLPLVLLWQLWKKHYRESKNQKQRTTFTERRFVKELKEKLSHIRELKNSDAQLPKKIGVVACVIEDWSQLNTKLHKQKKLKLNQQLRDEEGGQNTSASPAISPQQKLTIIKHQGRYEYEQLTLHWDMDSWFEGLFKTLEEKLVVKAPETGCNLMKEKDVLKIVKKTYSKVVPMFLGSLRIIHSRNSKSPIKCPDLLIEDGVEFIVELLEFWKSINEQPSLKGARHIESPVTHHSSSLFLLSHLYHFPSKSEFSLSETLNLLNLWYEHSKFTGKKNVQTLSEFIKIVDDFLCRGKMRYHQL